jgi:hypothetical protein
MEFRTSTGWPTDTLFANFLRGYISKFYKKQGFASLLTLKEPGNLPGPAPAQRWPLLPRNANLLEKRDK